MSVAVPRNAPVAADAAPGWAAARTATVGAVATTVIAGAVLAQISVLPWLPLPGGPPDLVLGTVVALALTAGTRAGVTAGFGGGLALDLVPPADHAVGQWALVLCIVGYLTGLLAREARESVTVTMATAGLAGFTAPLAFTLCGAVAGDPRVDWSAAAGALPPTVLSTVLVAPLGFAVFHRFLGER